MGAQQWPQHQTKEVSLVVEHVDQLVGPFQLSARVWARCGSNALAHTFASHAHQVIMYMNLMKQNDYQMID